MVRRILRITSIINDKNSDMNNRYIPGSGVGATSISVRRHKLIKATRTSAKPILPPSPPLEICSSMSFNPENGLSYLQYQNNNELDIEDKDFTIEWFQYFTGTQPFSRPFSIGSYDSGNISIAVSYEDSLYFWFSNSPYQIINDNPPLNVWTHIAIVGSGGNQITFYIDGVAQNTLPVPYFFVTEGNTPLTIGNETQPSSIANFSGQITNFRWVIGSQVYTSDFTPPNTPLSNITGTKLLLLANDGTNISKDSSSDDRTPTNINVLCSTNTPF